MCANLVLNLNGNTEGVFDLALVFFERYLLVVTKSSIPNVFINIYGPKQLLESLSSNVIATKRKNLKHILEIL